jgi:hypothetical protein
MKFDTLKEAVDFSNMEELRIDGTDSRNPHSSWLKNLFRRSDEWKSFCKDLILKRGSKCEKCGCEQKDAVSGLQVHHHNPKFYNDLTEENFSVLCGKCHLIIESFCITEEKMKMCPNVDKKFLTHYPYKVSDKILVNSNKFQIRKWCKELDATKNPGKYLNPPTKQMTGIHKKEVQDAVNFIKNNPQLFKEF